MNSPCFRRVFVNVARILRPRGLFQIDLNTRFALQWLSTSEWLSRMGAHPFTGYNEFDEAAGIATFHQRWLVKQGRPFRRFEVSVHERAPDDPCSHAKRTDGMRPQEEGHPARRFGGGAFGGEGLAGLPSRTSQ